MLIIRRFKYRNHDVEGLNSRAFHVDHLSEIECYGKEITIVSAGGKRTLLGSYDTNERATEVFNEILSAYMQVTTLCVSHLPEVPPLYNPPRVYEMPEE